MDSRRRLLFGLLAGFVLATGCFLAAILAVLREDALRNGAALSRSFAQVIEEQTARTVQSVDLLLGQAQRELRARQAPGAAFEDDMRALFGGLLSELPYVRALWFIDKDGIIRFDSDQGNVGTSLADRPYFAQYRQNPTLGLRLNDPVRSRSTGTWFIPVTRPVYDDAGGLLGVAVASLEPAYLDRVWSSSATDDRFAVLFLRRDGTVLMRTPFLAEIMGRSMADRALFKHHLAERPDGTLIDVSFVDTQMRLFAYRALREYPELVVIVSRTLHHVLADWRRFAWLALGGWLAASAALGLIALLLTREARRRRVVETNLRRVAAERAAVIDALPAHIALLDAHGSIVAVNEAWRMFGHSGLVDGSRGGVGTNYLLVCDNATGPRSQEAVEVAAGIRAVLQGVSPSYVLEYPCHSPTEQRWFRLMVAPLPDRDAPGAVVMHVDITDRKQDDELHAAESRVLEMISTGAALSTVLEKLTLLVEAILPSTVASIVLLDRASGRLRQGAAPNLPAEYAAAIQDMPIGPNAGSCGTAMYRCEQVVTDDIDCDPLWTGYRDLVRPYGFRSCWSTPIVSADRQVLASFALYFRESRKPTETDQRLIDRAVHLARIAIEHHQKDHELRVSAQSLRRGEQRFQALANATFDAIWDRDIKTNSVWWSEGFKTAFGFTEQEMAERPYSWRKRVHPDDLARVLTSVEDAMRRGQTNWHEKYRFFDRSGRMLYIEDRARFIYEDDGGEPVRVVGGMTDVTSMHEARQRIDELQHSLSTLVEAAKIGILVHRDFKPLLANDELARMFGYASPAEILAMADCRALFAPEEIERISAYNEARRNDGEAPGFYAVRGCRKDGARIELENRAFTIPWEGEISVCAMLVDVTERLALEAQLRQVQRLEAVGQLTGGVAHDFNNLLQVILGNAEHLERSLSDNASLRQMAELTRVAAERGATLTNRLLAFSRRQALAPTVTDVGAAIAGMSELLRRTLGEQVTINVVQRAELWRAFIDAPQFESAVLNLGINARDAIPGGGQLTIELDNVVLDQAYARQAEVEPGDYVLVAISDTGEGMTPEVLARAFEPFFTTKDVGKGSGLGLSMVLGFIKQSQGHVKIYSEPGQGTTVKLYLPRAVSGAAGVAPKVEEGPLPRGTERILLVEDDDLVRSHAATLLKALGYNVTTAAHGHEAIELLRSGRRFDLLFTDVVMPGGLNGRQLAERAGEIQPGLPVLFTSGYTDTAIVQHGHLEPGVHMIAKPYRRLDLAHKLREVLVSRAVSG